MATSLCSLGKKVSDPNIFKTILNDLRMSQEIIVKADHHTLQKQASQWTSSYPQVDFLADILLSNDLVSIPVLKLVSEELFGCPVHTNV